MTNEIMTNRSGMTRSSMKTGGRLTKTIKARGARVALAALLVLAVAFAMVPQAGVTSYAASGEASVTLGPGVLAVKANKDDAPTVYLSDKAWRVIGYDGAGVAGTSGALTLLSSGLLGNSRFHELETGVPFNNYYSDSELKTAIDNIAGAMDSAEKDYIIPRTLKAGSYSGSDTDCVAGTEVKDALLWPLSIKEANATNTSIRVMRDNHWWLRSPGDSYVLGSMVATDGVVYDGVARIDLVLGIRPALHFSIDPVLLTSAAAGGKASGETGPDALTAVETNTSGEWKFTFKDAARKDFAVDSVWTCDGKDLHITYSGAISGGNNYVSGLIVKSDGTVSYYGRLDKPIRDTGEFKVNIDGKMGDGDKFYLISEEMNGDKKSDFASDLVEVKIPEGLGHDWEYWGMEWTGSESEGYTAAVANYACKRDYSHKTSVDTVITSEMIQEPVCTNAGTTRYTARVSADNAPDGKSRQDFAYAKLPEQLGHDWQPPTYTWAEDNSTVTANRVCRRFSYHIRTETVNTTSEITKPATCTEKGETTYTATFQNTLFETQTKAVENIEATGHDWEFKGFAWTGDADHGYTAATANFTCRNDEKHTQAIPVDIREKQVRDATCTEDGRISYSVEIAAADSPDKAKHEETVYADVPKATGHDWQAPTYTWDDANSMVTAERVCGNDPAHKESEDAETRSRATKKATCTEKGETTYTATFKNKAFEKQTKTVTDIRALGHDWDDGEATRKATCSEEGEKTLHCRECDAVKTEKIARTAHTLTKHNAVRPTCVESGSSAYWSCSECGKLFSDKSGSSEIDEEDTVLPALGHDFRYTGMTWVDDMSSATADFVCRHDAEHTDSVAAEVKSETVDSTYDSRGITVYTATAVYDGVKYTESVTAGIDPKKREDQGGSGGGEGGRAADGTEVGPGADAAAAENAIMNAASDEGPAGTAFAPLKLRSTKQTAKSVKLRWTPVSGATRYVVYGNRCGKKNKMKKLATVTGKTRNITKIAGRKLKKGKSYKFIIMAVNSSNKVVSTSKTIHVMTKGGKTGNHRMVRVSGSVVKKAKSLKKGKSLKLKAAAVKGSLKVKKHRALKYESTNPAVATVSSKGVVKGVSKGTCSVYAYAQNGIYKKINVTVK